MQFGTPQHLNGVDNRQFRTEDAAGIRLGTRGVNSDRTQIPVPSEVRILAGTIAPLPSFPDALRPEGDPKSAPALAPPQPCELGPFSVAVRRIRAMAEADGLALPGAGSDRGRRGRLCWSGNDTRGKYGQPRSGAVQIGDREFRSGNHHMLDRRAGKWWKFPVADNWEKTSACFGPGSFRFTTPAEAKEATN